MSLISTSSSTARTLIALVACMISWSPALPGCAAEQLKPRVVILTDVSTWETDDSESLVRLLVHADLVEIEGLVFTTGWSLGTTRADFIDLIRHPIDAYAKDLPNLSKRSGQHAHLDDETQQTVGYWPSANYLRERTVFGSQKRGAEHIGAGNDSAGSQLIINLVDEADDRPLWIAVWGGGNTVAQAVWRVKQDRTSKELQKFLGKLRVYTITDQDRDQKTPYSDSSHQWLRREFEKQLFFIWDECAWKYQNGTGRKLWTEYEKHIQNHGQLGSLYPKYKYGVEGDSPSLLHLLPLGLNDPNEPTQGGWGGYFTWGQSEDKETSCYVNFQKPTYDQCRQLEEHFYPATFNNFAARMNWARAGTGNRNPVVIVDKDATLDILARRPQAGSTLAIDASTSNDPEGDQLNFNWWILSAAGTFEKSVELKHHDKAQVAMDIPRNAAGKTIHLICEVTDNGSPNLTSYRRIIIAPTDKP